MSERLREALRQAYHDCAWLGGADHEEAWAQAEDRLAEIPREPDPWPVIEWLERNNPGALELCPYKVKLEEASGA